MCVSVDGTCSGVVYSVCSTPLRCHGTSYSAIVFLHYRLALLMTQKHAYNQKSFLYVAGGATTITTITKKWSFCTEWDPSSIYAEEANHGREE